MDDGEPINMRRLGYTLLFTAAVLTVVQIWIYSNTMPDPVASHFGANGIADAWMSKASFLTLHGGLQAVTAAFLIAVARFGRYLPDALLSMPHKDYWLHESRRNETLDYTEALLTLIAGLTAVFLVVVFHLVYQANVNGTEELSTAVFAPVLIAYILIVFWLTIRVTLRFSKKPRLEV